MNSALREKDCQNHVAPLGTFTHHPQSLSSGAHLSSGSHTSAELSYTVVVPVSSPVFCCCGIVWLSWADLGHESSLHFAWWLLSLNWWLSAPCSRSSLACAMGATSPCLGAGAGEDCASGVSTWQDPGKSVWWSPSPGYRWVSRALSWSALSERDHRSLGLAHVLLVPASSLTYFSVLENMHDNMRNWQGKSLSWARCSRVGCMENAAMHSQISKFLMYRIFC